MKTILIKIGKAISVLKRDGFLRGAKTLFNFMVNYVKIIFSSIFGDVLIITAGIGDSALYRAFNHAEELNLHGIKTAVTLADHPFLVSFTKKFKVFIFHRTMVTPKIAKLIENIKKQDKEIIFETDDLVFEKKFIQNSDFYKNKMNAGERLLYKDGVGREIVNDPYVKVCTTTTSYLADVLKQHNKKVFIVKNKFSNMELAIAKDVFRNIPKHQEGIVRIGYFSGTSSHDKDFATISDALDEILVGYKNVKLYLAGPLDIESKLSQKHSARIVILPFVPRGKYYENIWKVDINLAPLVLDDPFCESKSEIKFIEAGILGIPTVATGNRTFSESIEDGLDGFLARTKDEWIEKIGLLIENDQLRSKIGKNAREKVLQEYTNKYSNNKPYYDYLKSKLE